MKEKEVPTIDEKITIPETIKELGEMNREKPPENNHKVQADLRAVHLRVVHPLQVVQVKNHLRRDRIKESGNLNERISKE